MVEEKRVISLGFGISGLFLLAMSFFNYQSITGQAIGVDDAIIGVNEVSKYLAIFGIIFMAIAIVVETYELKKDEEEKKKRRNRNKK